MEDEQWEDESVYSIGTEQDGLVEHRRSLFSPPASFSWPADTRHVPPPREETHPVSLAPAPFSRPVDENPSVPIQPSTYTFSITERPVSQQEADPLSSRNDSIDGNSEQTLTERQNATRQVISDKLAPTPGQRRQPQLPRGVYSRPGLCTDEEVCEVIEARLGYYFINRDLLLEALESPGSGNVCVGQSNRPIPEGNRPLANVGRSVMELALMEQFYELQIAESEYPRMMIPIGRDNLARIGAQTEISKWIRPKKSLPPSQQRNVMILVMNDLRSLTGEKDPKRIIARAMRAIIGAVHLDGGQNAAVKVMTELRLLINENNMMGT